MNETKEKLAEELLHIATDTPIIFSSYPLMVRQQWLRVAAHVLGREEELRKDKERLDTVQKYCGDIDLQLVPVKDLLMSPTWICTGEDIRSALDKLKSEMTAALSAESEQRATPPEGQAPSPASQ